MYFHSKEEVFNIAGLQCFKLVAILGKSQPGTSGIEFAGAVQQEKNSSSGKRFRCLQF